MNEKNRMSQNEKDKILKSYFKEEKLINLPTNNQKRLVVLESISKFFESDREYTEREVNAILINVYEDIFLIRRELIEKQFMNRTRDGRSYWVNKEREEI